MSNKLLNGIVLTANMEATFKLADNVSASLCDALLSDGIGDRATAKPFVMKYVLAKYPGASIKAGQRGLTFTKRNTDAERAYYRIMDACFPTGQTDSKPKGNSKSKPAKFTRAMTSAANLFLAEFEGKTKAEQIKQALALLRSLQK